MKTSDLIGPALDYAVAVAKGMKLVKDPFGAHMSQGWFVALGIGYQRVGGGYSPSTNRDQGCWIIELVRMAIDWHSNGLCHASSRGTTDLEIPLFTATGPTMLIAAMRCFVYSKLGDEIEIPEELQ